MIVPIYTSNSSLHTGWEFKIVNNVFGYEVIQEILYQVHLELRKVLYDLSQFHLNFTMLVVMFLLKIKSQTTGRAVDGSMIVKLTYFHSSFVHQSVPGMALFN